MAILIHVNGPPGIGKSTMAQIYVDAHPGVLNLDIDRVRDLIGGSRQNFSESGSLSRSIALNMARTHLAAGYDVIVPQYLGRVTEIERFEAAAAESGAAFCEMLLWDERASSVSRFSRRGESDDAPWHAQVRELVAEQGGDALLADMYDQLQEVLSQRSGYVVVPSAEGRIRETYEVLTSALSRFLLTLEDSVLEVVSDTRRMSSSSSTSSESTAVRLRSARVLRVAEDACETWSDGNLVSVRFAPTFPSPRVERVSPGHLVAIATTPTGEEVVVWRWYDAVVLSDSDAGSVRLWEPAHGEVIAQARPSFRDVEQGQRAYASAGLPGADWWVAGSTAAPPDSADVELDAVYALYNDNDLWSAAFSQPPGV